MNPLLPEEFLITYFLHWQWVVVFKITHREKQSHILILIFWELVLEQLSGFRYVYF